ncbi:hypothetical protein PIB30_008209 [Stylosanthes scabra]|uniref:BLISTER n=1 Tax=Stylosanthes scabra TaxID=79078 RepID=A0ABU6Q502_9FABA|nr:hypothetical protein [Stylosanthes scabra]
MASAQVLPNSASSSRKQEHLEAGKRRLEEFRKKKAAERAKKAASSSNAQSSDASLKQNQASETENVRVDKSDGVTTSDGIGRDVIQPSTLGMSNDKSTSLISQSTSSKQESLPDTNNFARGDLSTIPTSLVETYSDIDEAKGYNASAITASSDASQHNEVDKVKDTFGTHTSGPIGFPYGTTNNQGVLLSSQGSQDFDTITTHSSLQGANENYSNKSNSTLKDYVVTDHGSSPYFSSKISPQVNTPLQNNSTNSSNLNSDYSHGSFSGGFGDSFGSKFPETHTNINKNLFTLHESAPKLDSTSYDGSNSFNHSPIHSVSVESSSRRTRPSFLDSLNVNRHSLGSPFRQPEQDSSLSNHLESTSNNISGSTYLRMPPEETKTVAPLPNFTTAGFDNSNQDALRIRASENGMEKKHDYYAPSKNEDFAALEQHIEDLTQEKFSLQRALEASQMLAESLAAENSSLTDNYNQQRSVVNQLKLDMAKLQEDIKVHLVELDSVKSEYANAQLECNAADERAKLLASEVISLEEKALRLRSNELKLEKQLENAEAEISSCRKKMSSLDKDCHHMRTTIEALQEEKKVLLSKLRKASGIGKSIESHGLKKDISTSTQDLASEDGKAENSDTHDAEASSSLTVPETVPSTSGISSANIPHDQMRMIENINALISELAQEKEDLMKALRLESSECTRMKEINKELSWKLEIQTQRLELLTAQSMVNENISGKEPEFTPTYDNTPYADEGDEVVERVLGWIMQLFPGGPSRRRTSKLR